MPIATHPELPDVPAFNLAEVDRLQSELLSYAESVLGPRMHAFSIAPARFVLGTTACTTRIGSEITIELDINAAKDWQCCVAELGHELVHALDGLTGYPTVLEEGIACAFGFGQCAALYDEVPSYLCKGRYLDAVRLVAQIPDQFAVIKGLRSRGLPIHRVTARDLIAAAPTIDARVATKLCERFLA